MWLLAGSLMGAALAATCVEGARAGCTFRGHVVCFTGKLRPGADRGVAATDQALHWALPCGLSHCSVQEARGGGVFLSLILQRWERAQRS